MDEFIIPDNVVLDSEGKPLSSLNRLEWLTARSNGVTATDINKIISPTLKPSSQHVKLLKTKLSPEASIEEIRLNNYMIHGNEREPIIADWAAGNFGMKANSYLFYGDNSQHLATPDGLGEGFVGEIKTSLKPLHLVVGYYMNQIQWQLNVMHYERCLFIVEQHKDFRPVNIDYLWVERDDDRIDLLVKHVNFFIEKMEEERNKNNEPS